MKSVIRIICLLFFITAFAEAATQRKIPSYEKYIKTYSTLAVEQQKKYKIPASITLAQGLLESGAGQSSLARRSNNHFGIKCHSDWRGRRVYHDDDLRGECFRKYKRVEDSYEDHSKFLKRSRYESLFRLKRSSEMWLCHRPCLCKQINQSHRGLRTVPLRQWQSAQTNT